MSRRCRSRWAWARSMCWVHSFGSITKPGGGDQSSGRRSTVDPGEHWLLGRASTRIFKQIKDSLDARICGRVSTSWKRAVSSGRTGRSCPNIASWPMRPKGRTAATSGFRRGIVPGSPMGWDVLAQMWGAKSDFHIDGNMTGFDLTPGLRKLKMPALVIWRSRSGERRDRRQSPRCVGWVEAGWRFRSAT